ncbi:MAG: hypothetical protein OIF32_12560 [Campylobacterales bacterium]|nr:hypothetical protein [Campylobacterales bacterium]
MREIFSLLFTIILLTGCAETTPTPSQKNSSKKEELIKKANSGDINSMLDLNELYLFPQTKEGLDLYNRWIDVVLQSDDIDGIIDIHRVYYKYRKMFVNGLDIRRKLLFRAAQLGSQEALSMLILDHIDKREIRDLHQKIIKKNNQNQLITLYNTYMYLEKSHEGNEVKKLITKSHKDYYDELSLSDKYYYLNVAYYKSRTDEKEFKRVIKTNLESDDLEIIIDTGKYLYKKSRRLRDAREFFEKAVAMNTQDSTIYLYLAQIYESYREDKKKIEETLKKAISMDNYKATERLLERYKEQKNSLEYLELKKRLLQQHNGKRALAAFLYENKKYGEAYKLYDELAQQNDMKAALFLAKEKRVREYEFDPEKDLLVKKYRKIILEADEPYLRSELKFFQFDKELKKKIIEIELQEKNLKTLKEMAFSNYGDKSIPYLKKAAEYGDIQGKYLLISKLSNYGEDFRKKVAMYEELIAIGDKKAYKELAIAYERKGGLDNIQKIVDLYEKAYEKGDKSVIDSIIGYYICPQCKILNDEKVQYYVDEAIKDKNTEFILRLARSYKTGTTTTKDLTKALKFFKIAYEIDKNPKTKQHIENLQNKGEK